jgi:hypothetical protein
MSRVARSPMETEAPNKATVMLVCSEALAFTSIHEILPSQWDGGAGFLVLTDERPFDR